ncbi:hypothetical protein [Luteococcus peritonei]|uniref:Uncharacterized protein n=1 Tax=Luteococcus peritonei TaxID=88874 RepID=A0ABW4RY07_9ACTN
MTISKRIAAGLTAAALASTGLALGLAPSAHAQEGGGVPCYVNASIIKTDAAKTPLVGATVTFTGSASSRFAQGLTETQLQSMRTAVNAVAMWDNGAGAASGVAEPTADEVALAEQFKGLPTSLTLTSGSDGSFSAFSMVDSEAMYNSGECTPALMTVKAAEVEAPQGYVLDETVKTFAPTMGEFTIEKAVSGSIVNEKAPEPTPSKPVETPKPTPTPSKQVETPAPTPTVSVSEPVETPKPTPTVSKPVEQKRPTELPATGV